MKLLGVLIGVLSGGATGLVVGFFTGNYTKDLVLGALISGIITLFLFKNRIEKTGIRETDELFDNTSSKVIMSNSWVFWLSNFIAALIVNAVERQDYFWSGFVSCSLSIIIAILFTSIGASFFGKMKV